MIKRGDMVMLVWACCAAGRKHVGWTGTVEHIEPDPDVEPCSSCGYKAAGPEAYITIDECGSGFVPLPWLIKIEPPGVRVETEEEVPA